MECQQRVEPTTNVNTIISKPTAPVDTVGEYIATMGTFLDDTRHTMELGKLVPDLYVKDVLSVKSL